MYAIEMYFDKETEEKIMHLAQKIADAGLSTKYLEWMKDPSKAPMGCRFAEEAKPAAKGAP